MSFVAGVDACRGGWVAVVADDGGFVDSLLTQTFAQLLDRLRGATALGVDIPIGPLSDRPRAADYRWNVGSCYRRRGSSCRTSS